jgi:hypothetical protein
MRNTHKILVIILKVKRLLVKPAVTQRTIFKRILQKQAVKVRNRLHCLRIVSIIGGTF